MNGIVWSAGRWQSWWCPSCNERLRCGQRACEWGIRLAVESWKALLFSLVQLCVCCKQNSGSIYAQHVAFHILYRIAELSFVRTAHTYQVRIIRVRYTIYHIRMELCTTEQEQSVQFSSNWTIFPYYMCIIPSYPTTKSRSTSTPSVCPDAQSWWDKTYLVRVYIHTRFVCGPQSTETETQKKRGD